MKSLERSSDFKYTIRLNVKTNSKTQNITNDNGILTIFLKSKPIQNKANLELINLFKKKLHLSSNQIQIISGSKSHDKVIEIAFLEKIEEQEILRSLLI